MIFLEVLKANGFEGDIARDLASRLTMATDNSIYQILPEAVLYPKNTQDVQRIFQLASQPQFHHVRFSPRGGGTGTDGQSLTSGIIIDVTRYMHQILEINVAEGFARIQPGVVLDQLNDVLKSHGVFFAPNVAPSSRATIGGMFGTDGCGKGSCCYGRTSQHVIESTNVLSDGSLFNAFETTLMNDKEQQIQKIVLQHAAEIDERFPKLARYITGYNLAKVYDAKTQTFNLNYLLGGSEGTLTLVTELKVQLTPIPRYTQLVVLQYAEFNDALCAARDLLAAKPTAIETIDDKVLGMAKMDVVYAAAKPMLEASGPVDHVKAINLVEFTGEIEAEVQAKVDGLLATLNKTIFYVTSDPKEMSALWDLRKKSVGLLGNLPGNRRPIPFIEDTMVPPERLAEFVQEFRALLDSHGLHYGMFGHVDAGCLHVRPALDMVDPADAALIPILTDAVYALVKKYGGILWGEHGQGFRSCYAPDYFGPTLYHAMREVKTLFDPYNQLNPGKIASSLTSKTPLASVNSTMRGDFDRQIDTETRQQFEPVMKCNGNGQCFQYDMNMVMCPSSKITRDRVHSPKGRATVMREWLRLRATDAQQAQDFSEEVYQAMAGCLGCKGCSTACPVKVDIPRMKAQFLEEYHTTHKRTLRDQLVARMEGLAHWQGIIPELANEVLRVSRGFLCKIGLVDLPEVSEQKLSRGLLRRDAPVFSLDVLTEACNRVGAEKVVCLLRDGLSFYQAPVFLAAYDFLTQQGFEVFVLPYRENGKLWHVKGFLKRFKKIAEGNNEFYGAIAKTGASLVGIEPSMTLVYRDEYVHALGKKPEFMVQLLQEFLMCHSRVGGNPESNNLDSRLRGNDTPYILFGHCSERSLAPDSQKQWQEVFQKMGLSLEVASVGCCGMAGVYGHEVEHQAESKGIFEMSWKQKIQQDPSLKERLLVTGFSCACQTKRFEGFEPRHPMEVLLPNHLKSREFFKHTIGCDDGDVVM